jgi:hypothetical protein
VSLDQNKGPIYGVSLPDKLPLGRGGFFQAVPRRDELNKVRERVGERTVAALEVALSLVAAIERSGYDISPCMTCGSSTVCIPDGLALCRPCAEKAGVTQ